MAVPVNMPDGSVLMVDPKTLLWLRHALKEEFNGTIALRFAEALIFSAEPLEDLFKKFSIPAETKLVQLTPPVQPDKIWVNAMKVTQVTPSGNLHSPQANAVLKFSIKMFLAVRENEQQAIAILNGPAIMLV